MTTMLRANGITVHVAQLEPEGSDGPDGPAPAPTAVMVHGMAQDTMASWYFTLAQPLRGDGARVIMYDLRGHGRSERPPSGYRLEDFVDDLREVLDGLGATNPVCLLGNSFGGTIAFAFAIRYPERVNAIVAIESAPPTKGWMTRVAGRLSSAADRLPAGEALAEIGAARGARAMRRAAAARDILTSTTLVHDISTSRLPSDAQIAGIRCPVLCLYGDQSQVRDFAPVVRGRLPQARTVIVPGGRHSILVDRPAEVHEVVADWLDRNHLLRAAVPTARPE